MLAILPVPPEIRPMGLSVIVVLKKYPQLRIFRQHDRPFYSELHDQNHRRPEDNPTVKYARKSIFHQSILTFLPEVAIGGKNQPSVSDPFDAAVELLQSRAADILCSSSLQAFARPSSPSAS